jgi:hypothetical protein
MNNEDMMRYLLATMEEVAKGHFTPKVAAQEVMAAIRAREKDQPSQNNGHSGVVNADAAQSAH